MQGALKAQSEEICSERVSLVSHLGAATRKALQGWPTWARRGGTFGRMPIPHTRAGKVFEVLYKIDREPRKAANPGVEAEAGATRSSGMDKKCGDVCKRRRRRSVLAAWRTMPT